MGAFEIEWKGSSERDLKKIDRRHIPKIIEAALSLSENPFPPQSRKLVNTDTNYRLRVGDFRVIYKAAAQSKTITILPCPSQKRRL